MRQYETLMCQSCYRDWDRVVVRGRKPHTCPNCRPAPATRRPRLIPAIPNTIFATNHNSTVLYTDGGKTEAGFTSEANDCTVRCLVTATGCSYRDAHTFMASSGRKPRKGHYFDLVLARCNYRLFGVTITPTPIKRARGLRTALLRNPTLRTGTWIVQMPRHVATLKNSVLLDSFDSSAKEIRYAWQVTPL